MPPKKIVPNSYVFQVHLIGAFKPFTNLWRLIYPASNHPIDSRKSPCINYLLSKFLKCQNPSAGKLQPTNQPTNHLLPGPFSGNKSPTKSPLSKPLGVSKISNQQTVGVSSFLPQDLVQKRFGNSSAAKGLEALLGEARAAEAFASDRYPLALEMCVLRDGKWGWIVMGSRVIGFHLLNCFFFGSYKALILTSHLTVWKKNMIVGM